MSNEIPDTDPAREVRNMVRHIILWKLKESFSEEEKAAVKAGIKEGLESLKEKIPGILSIEVHTEGLASSTFRAEVLYSSTPPKSKSSRSAPGWQSMTGAAFSTPPVMAKWSE